MVLLGCKPYMAGEVLRQQGVYEAVRHKLIISVLSGISPDQIRRMVVGSDETEEGIDVYVTRATPNIAARFGKSMTVVDGTSRLRPEMLEFTQWVFDCIGATDIIGSDVAGVGAALAGASPAFLSVALDGLLDGAVAEGLKRPEAKKMLVQVLDGLVEVLRRDDNMENLRQSISSPRGTTIQGLLTLEESRVRFAFSRAIMTGAARFRAIGEESK